MYKYLKEGSYYDDLYDSDTLFKYLYKFLLSCKITA